MAMLASLTSTALTRQWPPQVYARLTIQLRDSADLGSESAVLGIYEQLVADLPLNPLLMEYIATLALDQHAILWFPVLLRRFAEHDWRARPEKLKALIAYVARSSVDWVLPSENETLLEELSQSARSLVVQAAEGSEESRLLLESLARGKLLTQVAENTSWLASIETWLPSLGHPFTALFGRAATEPPKSAHSEDTAIAPVLVTPSRSMRLLWLEWLLGTSQPLTFQCLKDQLDIMWAGDRVPTVSYELCVTAFDVYAAKPKRYVMAFILYGLPCILQQLARETPDILDGVLARVFTTMDKEVAEAMDLHSPSLRTNFGSICIDMGLCDPTVLHALHRSHVPRQLEPLTYDDISKEWDFNLFGRAGPEVQAKVAQDIVHAAQGALPGYRPLERHSLALLCTALYQNPDAVDQVFVHAPVRDFLHVLVEHADAASLLWEEEGGAGLVYGDLGAFLATVDMLTRRYRIGVPVNTWTHDYLKGNLSASIGQLSPEQSQLLGQWVKGLFSGSGSGIGDDLLRPFRELVTVLPAMLRQAVLAYRSAVIDRETLKSGLDYFVQPFSVVLVAPLVLRVLHDDLFEGLHQSATLEIAVFYLTMILQKSSPDVFVAKAAIAHIAHKMQKDINPARSNVAIQKLAPTFAERVATLTEQVGSVAVEEPEAPNESSLAEAVKRETIGLAEWQARPQGVPALPLAVMTFQAKSALGTDKVRDVIERAAAGSPDTVLALLLADTLWSRSTEPRLVDATGDMRLSQSARDVSTKLSALSAQREAEHNRELAALKEEVRNLPPPIVEVKQPVKEEIVETNREIPMDTQAREPEPDVQQEPKQESLLPSDMNYGEEFMMDDFSADFVNSQPMNLADLDSAMDFGWE